jgi:hypothetical protein
MDPRIWICTKISWILNTVYNVLYNRSGRASGTPTLDLFVTLLSMGVSDFKQLLANRKNLYLKLKQDLQALATRYVYL